MPPSPWIPVVLSACAISLTMLSVVAIPLVRALIALNVTLTELKEHDKQFAESHKVIIQSQEELREEVHTHVQEDRASFADAVKMVNKVDTAVGGLHAKVLTIQEKFGLVHHDPPIQIGEGG